MPNSSYDIDISALRSTIERLKNQEDFHLLLDITATDYMDYPDHKGNRFELIYILRDKSFTKEVIVRTFVDDESLMVPTISDLYYAANWAERETFDQYGIVFDGHPNLKRVLNHHQFVGHPLRKDYDIQDRQICTKSADLMDEMTPKLASMGLDKDDVMLLNIGPSHPTTHGTIRNFAALEGESIVASVTEIGYLHRGFEKACEVHTYNQIIPYTDRLNYCSAILNNIGFCKGVEEMLEIEIPDRAKFIRVIIGELSRMMDHAVCNAANFVDLGGLTNYWYLFDPRDKAYDLLSKLTGARLTNSYTRVGGLAYDLYDGFEQELDDVLKAFESSIEDALSLVAHNRIFLDRTQDVGVIDKQFAIDAGITGPNLRAAGVAYDMRTATPYYHYDSIDFDVVVGSHGDVYDRIMVRFEEMRQSIRIIRSALKMMPDGAISVDDKSITMPTKSEVYGSIEGTVNQFKLVFEGVKVPAGSHYSATEAGNGELGFYIVSDGSGTPYKVKCRPPSFYALGAYSKIVEGGMIADAVITMASMNFIAGEFDR